jgi:hypothetical protein
VKKSAPAAMSSTLPLEPPPDHISYFERALAIDRRWPDAKISHRAAAPIMQPLALEAEATRF